MNGVGLYVHIPFCDAKCTYCDFVRFTDRHHKIDAYLEALLFEATLYRETPVKTLFIGGGTPSLLNPSQIERLFSGFHSIFDFAGCEEATIEMNPESTSAEKLIAFQKAGVNRLSFGLQATQNPLLESLQRLHSVETFLSKYEMARKLGFSNINVDLIFGLPGQSAAHWEETLDLIVELKPEHVSTYALKIEPGTTMGLNNVTVNSDEQADMYLEASRVFTESGYSHYEISNFAKPGFESKHNLLYWENDETIGLGISSVGYRNGRRIKNTSNLDRYLEAACARSKPNQEETVLDDMNRDRENVMLKLRLKKGVDAGLIENLKIPMVNTFLEHNLAQINKGVFSLTPQGWLLSNQLFQYFVS